MKIKFTPGLSFLFNKNISDGYIEERNGTKVLVSGQYQQVLKESEYQKLLAASDQANVKEDDVAEEETVDDMNTDSTEEAKSPAKKKTAKRK